MKKINLILLIDDDSTNNFINEMLLKGLNIAEEIKVLTNGQLALDYIVKNCHTPSNPCPSLIILDHFMPVMDGLEFMTALNQNGVLAKMEVVFLLLSIETRLVEIETFKKLGVTEFTSKPLSEQAVMDAYKKYWAGDTI